MSVPALIVSLNLSDEEIAVKLHVSAAAVAKWRKGKAVPRSSVRQGLCKLCGLKPSDIDWNRKAVTT